MFWLPSVALTFLFTLKFAALTDIVFFELELLEKLELDPLLFGLETEEELFLVVEELPLSLTPVFFEFEDELVFPAEELPLSIAPVFFECEAELLFPA